MKSYPVKDGKTISIPTTGDDWDLYTCEMKCGRAAASCTAGLVRGFKAFERATASGAPVEAAIRAADKVIQDALSKHSAFGSTDTEPRYVKRRALSHYVAARLGLREYEAADLVNGNAW